MSATDFTGKPLEKGQRVAFVETGYRNLKRGEVIKVSARQVTIEFIRFGKKDKDTTQRSHNDVIVLTQV